MSHTHTPEMQHEILSKLQRDLEEAQLRVCVLRAGNVTQGNSVSSLSHELKQMDVELDLSNNLGAIATSRATEE